MNGITFLSVLLLFLDGRRHCQVGIVAKIQCSPATNQAVHGKSRSSMMQTGRRATHRPGPLGH